MGQATAKDSAGCEKTRRAKESSAIHYARGKDSQQTEGGAESSRGRRELGEYTGSDLAKADKAQPFESGDMAQVNRGRPRTQRRGWIEPRRNFHHIRARHEGRKNSRACHANAEPIGSANFDERHKQTRDGYKNKNLFRTNSSPRRQPRRQGKHSENHYRSPRNRPKSGAITRDRLSEMAKSEKSKRDQLGA